MDTPLEALAFFRKAANERADTRRRNPVISLETALPLTAEDRHKYRAAASLLAGAAQGDSGAAVKVQEAATSLLAALEVPTIEMLHDYSKGMIETHVCDLVNYGNEVLSYGPAEHRLAGPGALDQNELPPAGKPPEPHADEVEEPYVWWKGTPHKLDIPPRQWDLLKAIWDKDQPAIADIGKAMGRRSLTYDEIKSDLSRLRDALLKFGPQWHKVPKRNYLKRSV